MPEFIDAIGLPILLILFILNLKDERPIHGGGTEIFRVSEAEDEAEKSKDADKADTDQEKSLFPEADTD